MSTPYDPTLILLGLTLQKLFSITPGPYDTLPVLVHKVAVARGLTSTPYDKLERQILEIYNSLPASVTIPPAGGSPPAESNPALTNLVAYWKLDETSSTNRVDASGNGHTLVVNGTVNPASGKINNGAAFDNNPTNRLGVSGTDFSGAFPCTIFCWVNFFGSLSSAQSILAHYTSSGFGSGWQIRQTGGSRIGLRVSDGAGNSADLNHGQVITIGIWNLVIVTFTGAGSATIRVNAGADTTSAIPSVGNPAVELRVGAQAVLGEGLNGAVDEIGYFNRVLTSDEKTALYNSGAGKQYPFS